MRGRLEALRDRPNVAFRTHQLHQDTKAGYTPIRMEKFEFEVAKMDWKPAHEDFHIMMPDCQCGDEVALGAGRMENFGRHASPISAPL